jgi:SAM-dependent methyltransferase
MAERVAALAQPERGQCALDLATGTGLIARALAQFTDSVVGADISQGILRLAHKYSEESIPYVVADAHRLPIMDQSFDLVTCGVSLSHFSDVTVALGEVRRVLRPGGQFITSAWSNEGENQSKAAAVEVRKQILTEREISFGGSFSEELWADVGRGREALMQAGFVDVGVTSLPLSGSYANHSEATEAALAWPVTRYRIAQLARADQRILREETAAAIAGVDDLSWLIGIHYYQATRPGV